MLKEAVAYYNELLEDFDLSESSRLALDEGLEGARLIFGGRRLMPYLRPHFVTAADWHRAKYICEVIWGSLQKVKEAAIGDDELLDELGITEIEKELVAIDPGYEFVSPSARLDSFLTEHAYSFVELNGESPAGIAYADSAAEIFMDLPVMKKFRERYDVQAFQGRPKMLEVILACYEEYLGKKPSENPVIAIVDLKDLPTQKEFELFRDYFESEGYTSIICSPDELEFDGEKLYCKGVKIDVVYRRLLVNEYLPIIHSAPDLLNAYRAGAICMVNSFRAKIVHKKAIFAVLTNEHYAHLFDEDELKAIKAHIPWTRKFREEKTINSGQEIDLVEWTRENSQKLVLKPNDDYGGHGIYIGGRGRRPNANGTKPSNSRWQTVIISCRKECKLQKKFSRCSTIRGNYQMIDQLVDLDPLLFNGVVGSAFTRLSSTELANVTSGGGMVPTLIIREKE